jgi:NAD(P)-dependent dehydrogenase (short-subunit alcohol dehydrogenase family)
MYRSSDGRDGPDILSPKPRGVECRRTWMGVAMQRVWSLLSGTSLLPACQCTVSTGCFFSSQFRTLQPLLLASKSTLGARVIWMSSIEASPAFYDSDDWQLIKTKHSYESSKYQIDIIATNLDRRAIEEIPQGSAVKVRHVVVQPGIAATNISNALTGSILDLIKLLTFYIVN